jgi:hypothetical protein
MPNTPIVATPLGDALRNLAGIVDGVPALQGALRYPDIAQALLLGVSTSDALRVLARDFGATVREYVDPESNTVTSSFDAGDGLVSVHLYAIEPLPTDALLDELRRDIAGVTS